jgi:hypothetical protein
VFLILTRTGLPVVFGMPDQFNRLHSYIMILLGVRQPKMWLEGAFRRPLVFCIHSRSHYRLYMRVWLAYRSCWVIDSMLSHYLLQEVPRVGRKRDITT